MSSSESKDTAHYSPRRQTADFTDHDWQEIETAYGEAIPSQVRAQIIQLSERFLCFSGLKRGQ